MLNKAPIFVNGFQRGGTNILMQLISSHPDVHILGAEVHELFYGRDVEPVKKWLRRLAAAPVVLATRQHTFWPYRYYARRPLPAPFQRYVDLLFYIQKGTARNNHYHEGVTARTLSWQEKSETRTLCKCVNGVVLATPLFAQMYPNATFIALVRNGFALCEGFMRRGWSPEKFGQMYQTIVCQMWRDAQQLPNYHLVTFEALLQNPSATVQQIYALAGLDIAATEKFKLQAKKSMSREGQRQYTFGNQDKAIQWYSLEELGQHLRHDVNENQIARLAAADKAAFLQHAHEAMSVLGYLP